MEIALRYVSFNHFHFFFHFSQGSNFSKAASDRPNLGQIPSSWLGAHRTFQVTFPPGIVNGKVILERCGHSYQRKAKHVGQPELRSIYYILLKRIASSCAMIIFQERNFKMEKYVHRDKRTGKNYKKIQIIFCELWD